MSQDPEVAIATVLGSCVAACVCDPVAGVGGVNHFMLPESDDGAWVERLGSLRYGNFAMDRLLDDIAQRGGRRARLEVKLFGAAHLSSDPCQVGESNAVYAVRFLAALGLRPLQQHLRGRLARRVVYHPVTGRAFMAELHDRSAMPPDPSPSRHHRS